VYSVPVSNGNSVEVGAQVVRMGNKFPSMNGIPGEIVAVDAERVQILWSRNIGGKPSKSWQQRKAQGKRWQLA
jgi:hypothetical protein